MQRVLETLTTREFETFTGLIVETRFQEPPDRIPWLCALNSTSRRFVSEDGLGTSHGIRVPQADVRAECCKTPNHELGIDAQNDSRLQSVSC